MLIYCIICSFISIAKASSPWNFNLDLKYENEKTDQERQKDETDEIQHEYQVKYSAPISAETKLESELKAEFEKKSSSSETKDWPYWTFRVKSRLYGFMLGYKESEEEEKDTAAVTGTKNAYFDLKLQPEYLPAFNVKYDFERKIDPNEPHLHKFSLNSSYNVKNFFKIRLNYRGEMTNYKKQPGDIKEGDFLGQMSLKHFLFRKKLRFDFDYKYEEESEKEKREYSTDPNILDTGTYWGRTQDGSVRTAITKLTYKITPDTILTTHYENKDEEDKTEEGEEEKEKDTFWVNINQRIWSFIKLAGKYKYQKNHERKENKLGEVELEDNLTDNYEAQIAATPSKWLDLRGRIKFESKDIKSASEDNDRKEDNQSIEGTWKSHFPEFFNARNTFNVKFVKEKDNFIDPNSGHSSEREEHYKWKLHLIPIVNFNLVPEYNVSEEEDITHEFKTTMSYKLYLANQLKFNLSHTLSRKSEGKAKENNDDTKLNIKFTPKQNLIFSTQIVREDSKTITKGNVDQNELNISYAFNYDWRFNPFTWSSSFKYDDRNDDNDVRSDTETFETKLTYKIKNYDLTANYKYTKTYSIDYDKEQRIGLQLRAHY